MVRRDAPRSASRTCTAGTRYYLRVVAINSAGRRERAVGRSERRRGQPGPPRRRRPPAAVQTYFAEGRVGLLRLPPRGAQHDQRRDDRGRHATCAKARTPVARSYSLPARAPHAPFSAADVPELNGHVVRRRRLAPARRHHRAHHALAPQRRGRRASAKALARPSTTWYLAEGNAGFFDTFVLLANPGTVADDGDGRLPARRRRRRAAAATR